MGSSSGHIFISYRQADTRDVAERLAAQLRDELADDAVFIDVLSMRAGDDLHRTVAQAVRSCNVLVAVIGPAWDKVKDSSGARRLDDPKDFVRWEIATAFEAGLHVIPVLVDRDAMPAVGDLPLEIAPLSRLLWLGFRRERDDIAEIVKETTRRLAQVKPLSARLPAAAFGTWIGGPGDGTAILQYDFYSNGTYSYVSIIRQARQDGFFVFTITHEGLAAVDGPVLTLSPVTSTTSRSDPESPWDDYRDRPRALDDIRLRWRLDGRLLQLTDAEGTSITYTRL